MADIIEIKELSKQFVKRLDLAEKIAAKLGFNVDEESIQAVDGVSISMRKQEVLGLVGESGCGKSTLGRMVAGILEPTKGKILYDGRTISGIKKKSRAMLQIQMIFQDPFASLNPRMRVEDIIGEAPVYHGMTDRKNLSSYVEEMLNRVGLDSSYVNRYPHQFSGGQRQRIGIARALAVKPEFLVCDEAIAALDVSIQAQIINLFMDLRQELNLTYLFISHDLSVVEHISDRVAIMYLGRLVEVSPTSEIFNSPNHPYTSALLNEVPRVHLRGLDYKPISGEIPSPINPPTGCHFHLRCPYVMKRCSQEQPRLKDIAPGRLSACHLNDQ